jgi:tetratricopeptide (TPR) repeat protein
MGSKQFLLVITNNITKVAIAIFAPLIFTEALTQSAYASSAIEVGRIAKAVTVMINSSQSTGSGVIIQKTGNSYTVLTAAHVVRIDEAKGDRLKTLTVTTQDGEKYPTTSINSIKDADLAIVKFESKNPHQLVKLGDSAKSTEGATVYVSGFPLATQAISDTIYNFTEGKVTANASRPLSYGYSLVYSNNTLPGMSGGPVFNAGGELIAIHGRGDFQEGNQVSEINETVRIKTGFNLGITIATVLKLSSNLGLTFPSLTASIPIAIAAAPKSDDFFLQGVDRFRRGDWAGAVGMMDKAIQLNPKYLRAYTARGAANYMLNRVARGLVDMEEAIAIDPNYATGYVGKCFLLNELEQWGQALGNCDRAIALAPKLSIAYNVRGVVNTSLNNLAPAQSDLEKAIALDPNSYYAYNNLGLVYALRNNIQVAFKYVRQALELYPQSAGSRVFLGQLFVLSGDYQRGISELNRAIAINPRISSAYEYRAAAYLGLGNVNQAKIDAQIAKNVAQSSPKDFIEDLSFLNQ